MKYLPHSYQETAEAHVLAKPSAALFLDMGLGKTVVTLTAIAKLIDSCAIRCALVVAPMRVCDLVWPQEVEKWDHLRWLRVSRIRGSPVSKKMKRWEPSLETQVDFNSKPSDDAIDVLSRPTDIMLVNYELLGDLCFWMSKQKVLPWDTIVFDESSKMKASDAKRFKLLKPQLNRFDRRLIMTGTPAPQGYEDLWSQIYLLDEGKRLGKFITHYRDEHFREAGDYDLVLRHGHDKIIQAAIADLVLCLSAKDHLKMPMLTFNEVKVDLPAKAKKQYETFEEEMFIELATMEVEAFNAAALSAKCRQLTSGAVYSPPVYDTYGRLKGERTWEVIHDTKLDALEDIIEEAAGSPVLVAYEFQSEIERLLKRWKGTPWIGGGAVNREVEKAVLDWNAGKVPLMFVHPASVGHGINLQYGGHILVFISGTWSLELWEQTYCRLYRQGQEHPVIVHSIIARGTIDTQVTSAIRSKAKTQSELIEALKKYREEKTLLI